MRSISRTFSTNKRLCAAFVLSLSALAANAAKEWQYVYTGNGYFFEDKAVHSPIDGDGGYIEPASPSAPMVIAPAGGSQTFKAAPPVEGYTLRDGTNQWAILGFDDFRNARVKYLEGNAPDLSTLKRYEANTLSGWEITLDIDSFMTSPPDLYTAPEFVEIVPCFQWIRYDLYYYPNYTNFIGCAGWLTEKGIVYTNDIVLASAGDEWPWSRTYYELAGYAFSPDAEEPVFEPGATVTNSPAGWPGKQLGANVTGTTNCVISLYGVWKPKVRIVSLVDLVLGETNTVEVSGEDKCPALPAPKAGGYEFKGWYLDLHGEKPLQEGDDVAKDTTAYAIYERLPLCEATDAPFDLEFKSDQEDNGISNSWTIVEDEFLSAPSSLKIFREDDSEVNAFYLQGEIAKSGVLSFNWKSSRDIRLVKEAWRGPWFQYSSDGGNTWESCEELPSSEWSKVEVEVEVSGGTNAVFRWQFGKYHEYDASGQQSDETFLGLGYAVWLDDIAFAPAGGDGGGEDEGGEGDGGEGGVDVEHDAGFAFAATNVYEGATLLVPVWGGATNSAASVKVYLSYNTAAAADVDLKTGSVSGGEGAVATQNLKFPLTLEWDEGEVGVKYVSIPVKADKTLEYPEFFTLQLADAAGMEPVVDEAVVTIHDAAYDALAAKYDDGTISNAELKTWDKLEAARLNPYMRALAYPASAGKTAGSATCAAGKRVALKATANKGYVFTGWVDSLDGIDRDRLLSGAIDYIAATPSLAIDRSSRPAKSTSTSTVLTNVSENATFYAMFITAEEDKASIALSVGGADLSAAQPGTPAMSTNVWAGVYLEWPVAASSLSGASVKVSGLPSGLKFASKPVTSKIGSGKNAVTVTNVPANTIYGAPAAASKTNRDGIAVPSQVKVTVTTGGKSSIVQTIALTVDALPYWVTGTFNGAVADADGDGGEVGRDDLIAPSGIVLLTVAANGKISGKLLTAGQTWTLSAPYFETLCEWRIPSNNGHVGEEEGLWKPGDIGRAFGATLLAKSGKAVATNYVDIAETRFADAISGTGCTTRGEASAAMEFPAGSLPSLIPHPSSLSLLAFQNLWKTAPWKTMAKPFARAAALTLYIDGDGAAGNEVPDSPYGTVTLKFATSGAATAKGRFVTGQDARGRDIVYSASCTGVLVPLGGESIESAGSESGPWLFRTFLHFPPKKGKFDGFSCALDLEWDGTAFSLQRGAD